jgi:hypothetical protein
MLPAVLGRTVHSRLRAATHAITAAPDGDVATVGASAGTSITVAPAGTSAADAPTATTVGSAHAAATAPSRRRDADR